MLEVARARLRPAIAIAETGWETAIQLCVPEIRGETAISVCEHLDPADRAQVYAGRAIVPANTFRNLTGQSPARRRPVWANDHESLIAGMTRIYSALQTANLPCDPEDTRFASGQTRQNTPQITQLSA